ncbi:MAG: hypothetical protein ACK5L6_06130 [Anaerorhabdus sp.]|uniref:hypothetical protein n=1 Tax=Anaerorhabdus sp. TaxID=1872524 RepID=UPI003A8A4F37
MTEQSIKLELNIDDFIRAIEELKLVVLTKSQLIEKLTYTTHELAEAFHTHDNQISMWRQCKALKGIKKGKEYIYSRKEIDIFLDDYAGCDLSNENKTLKAVHEVYLRNNKKESSTAKSVNSLRI